MFRILSLEIYFRSLTKLYKRALSIKFQRTQRTIKTKWNGEKMKLRGHKKSITIMKEFEEVLRNAFSIYKRHYTFIFLLFGTL